MTKIFFLVSTLLVLVLAPCVLGEDSTHKSPDCPKNCKPTLFFPDYDCSYFWICRNGVAERHNCYPFEWDTTQNSCVPPEVTTCVDGQGWNSSDLICPVITTTPSTTTTTKKPTTTKTTTTTEPTTTTKRTTTTKPTTTKSTSTTNPTTTPKPTTTTKPKTTTSTTSTASTTRKPKSPICPNDCPYNIYLPHYNCSLFWQCANGVATLLECPCDLHFNPEANVCDWPWNFEHDVSCKDWTWEDIVCEPPETTTSITTLDPIYPPPCPEDCPYNLHVGDKISCLYYYQCVDGKAYRRKCPEGLVFNSVSKTCDIGGCDYGRGWTWEDLICPDISTETPCCEKSTEALQEPPCPKGCPETLYVADYDCHKYWVCSNGIAKSMTCAANLWWDSKNKICDYEEKADCDMKGWDDIELICPPSPTTTTNKPETTTTPKPPKCQPGVVFYPNLKDCGTYWECANGAAHLMPCPDGLEWSTQDNRCDWPWLAGCNKIQ